MNITQLWIVLFFENDKSIETMNEMARLPTTCDISKQHFSSKVKKNFCPCWFCVFITFKS